MPLTAPFRGILPALVLPLNPDGSLDTAELGRLARWLAGHEGIGGLVTNGHTGEVFALTRDERAQVTRTVAEAVAGRVPVISGVCCEGIGEAVEHACLAREAGAAGLLLMPPHLWLRFGMEPEHVLALFTAVGEAAGINIVAHVYPAWTKASYSSELLAALARLPWVTTFKIGTRELSKYDRDLRAIRAADPSRTILTCHDEYLLSTMVQGVDGALVGFASLAPDWIAALYRAVCGGDLKTAQAMQDRLYILKEAVYGAGEPTATAHARLKTAMMLAGRVRSNHMRPPVRSPEGEALNAIRRAVERAGLLSPGRGGGA